MLVDGIPNTQSATPIQPFPPSTGDIHRAVTSHYKTPEPLRDPNMEMVQFTMHGTSSKRGVPNNELRADGWGTSPRNASWASIITPGASRKGYFFGQRVPEKVFQNPGVVYYASNGDWKEAADAPNTADARASVPPSSVGVFSGWNILLVQGIPKYAAVHRVS